MGKGALTTIACQMNCGSKWNKSFHRIRSARTVDDHALTYVESSTRSSTACEQETNETQFHQNLRPEAPLTRTISNGPSLESSISCGILR